MTAHEITDDGNIKELFYATGGNWGGTDVDANFITELQNALGNEVIREFIKVYPSAWLDVQMDFEQQKRSLESGQDLNISVPHALTKTYERIKGKPIDDAPQFDDATGYLSFKSRVVERMFQPVISKITDHIKNLLLKEELRGIQYIMLVGGFGQSSFLQKAVKTNFGRKVEILIPHEASLAVVKGAVIFGHSPDSIGSRIARRTYGYLAYSTFVEGEHDPGKKKMVEGICRCTDLFEHIVKKGEDIKGGESRTFSAGPLRSDQTRVTFALFSTDSTQVRYVDELGVEKLGQITVQLKRAGKDQTIEVKATFGGTEIHVQARDIAPFGDIVDTTIDFLAT